MVAEFPPLMSTDQELANGQGSFLLRSLDPRERPRNTCIPQALESGFHAFCLRQPLLGLVIARKREESFTDQEVTCLRQSS